MSKPGINNTDMRPKLKKVPVMEAYWGKEEVGDDCGNSGFYDHS